MNIRYLTVFAVTVLVITIFALIFPVRQSTEPVDYVDPFIGTGFSATHFHGLPFHMPWST